MGNLIEVHNLKQYFQVTGGSFFQKKYVKAVDDVSFSIRKGETLGLVGESGCGKTTTGRTILRLYEPTAGRIIYDGETIFDSGDVPLRDEAGMPIPGTVGKKTSVSMLPYRRKMQIVFQDPYASLDPRMTVGDIVGEAIDIHHLAATKAERRDKIIAMLQRVGLNSEHANRYPHAFSGGQRQRVGIARALAVDPEFIVCDEPISALDVSIQAQVLNLLQDLQAAKNLTYIFITHDLSVVRHISDDIMVMYVGSMVEKCASHELFEHPLHPYTKGMLSAVPIPSINVEKNRIIMQGELTSPVNPKPGCRFANRCPYATEECRSIQPAQEEVRPGHIVACHHVREINGL